MLLRNVTITGLGLVAFGALAASTEVGALAFLAPGVLISRACFRHQPGVYHAQGSGPDQAIVEYLVHKTAENYWNSLLCSIAFWLLMAVVIVLVLSRTSSRRAPNTSLDRTREG
jgi:hypothetical protein